MILISTEHDLSGQWSLGTGEGCVFCCFWVERCMYLFSPSGLTRPVRLMFHYRFSFWMVTPVMTMEYFILVFPWDLLICSHLLLFRVQLLRFYPYVRPFFVSASKFIWSGTTTPRLFGLSCGWHIGFHPFTLSLCLSRSEVNVLWTPFRWLFSWPMDLIEQCSRLIRMFLMPFVYSGYVCSFSLFPSLAFSTSSFSMVYASLICCSPAMDVLL